MSKHETPLTRRYWNEVGGALIEEYPAVKQSKTNGQRLLDGVIVLGEEHRIVKAHEIEIEGKDIIVIQTKANRLGMYLMGQVIFSKELMKPFKPKSIKSVAVCTATDSVLEPLLLAHDDVEVVVYDK
jgi:hypothetical protein